MTEQVKLQDGWSLVNGDTREYCSHGKWMGVTCLSCKRVDEETAKKMGNADREFSAFVARAQRALDEYNLKK